MCVRKVRSQLSSFYMMQAKLSINAISKAYCNVVMFVRNAFVDQSDHNVLKLHTWKICKLTFKNNEKFKRCFRGNINVIINFHLFSNQR